jgi:hypothetical protein
MDEVAPQQIVDSVDEWMRPGSFEPDVPAEVALTGSDRHEAATRLEDDPGLLGIYVNLPESADNPLQGLKEFANLRALAIEVFIDGVVAT